MCDLSFQSLPTKYDRMIDEIQCSILKDIYNQFTFSFLSISNVKLKEDDIKKILSNTFEKYKLIILSSNPITNHNNDVISFNITICVEKKCFIIDKIDNKLLSNILKNKNSTIINLDNPSPETPKKLFTEMEMFCKYFSEKKDYTNNIFVKQTLRVLSIYLIRRFFYPSVFFTDPSFFKYKQKNDTAETEFKNKFNLLLTARNVEEMQNNEVMQIFKDNRHIKDDHNKLENFEETDFIFLRSIHSKIHSNLNLVIHKESLHIFLMEKYNSNISADLAKQQKDEVTFYENVSHRCFVKCYGYLKKQNQIIGLIFEYICNGQLLTLIKNNSEKVTPLFQFTTINRIFQGLKFLYSNNYLHRDIKPSNILVDHDFVPFISDNETCVKYSYNQDEYNKDVASPAYSSPEQYKGDHISYSSDIFSFGLVIYFVFQRKPLISAPKERYSMNFDKIEPITFSDCNKTIKDLYIRCTKKDPKQRIDNYLIENLIFDEIILSNYIDQFFHKYDHQQIINELPQFLYENLLVLSSRRDFEYLNNYFYTCYKSLLNQIIKLNNSIELKAFASNNLGNLFCLGLGVKQDFTKAKDLYESTLRFDLKSSSILSCVNCNLGNLHMRSLGVEKDYQKAKEYYEKAANLNNPEAYYNLGYLYYNGYGVNEDLKTAKEYFKKAEEQNNINGINALGLMYLLGKGKKQKFNKSFNYFTKAEKLNSSDALVALGYMNKEEQILAADYLKSKDLFKRSSKMNNQFGNYLLAKFYKNDHQCSNDNKVLKNMKKTFKYFDKAIQLGSMDAQHLKGNLFFYGKGCEQSYEKAKECYQKAANQLNRSSLYKLGKMFENGLSVEQNYFKAFQFYELAADNGYNSVYILLANYFYDGEYFPIDENKAIEYLKKNLRTNDEKVFYEYKGYYKLRLNRAYYQAHNNLGLIYLFQGNLASAHKYLGIAASNNYYFASNNLALLYDSSLFEYSKQKFERARQKFEAAESNYISAKDNVDHIQKNLQYNSKNFECEKELLDYAKENFEKVSEYFECEKQNFENEKRIFEKNKIIKENINEAERHYSGATEPKFSLAEYNYAHMLESKGEINEAFRFYERALEHENKPFLYRGRKRIDRRLSISISYIMLYVACKLFKANIESENKCKQYFIKIIDKLKKEDETNTLTEIRETFLKFHFLREKNDEKKIERKRNSNIQNHNNLIINHPTNFQIDEDDDQEMYTKKMKDLTEFCSKLNIGEIAQNDKNVLVPLGDENHNQILVLKEPKHNNDKKSEPINRNIPKKCQNNKTNEKVSMSSKSSEILFNEIYNNEQLRNEFLKTIDDVMQLMYERLYTPPYFILFGRINIDKFKKKEEVVRGRNINDEFMKGFGID